LVRLRNDFHKRRSRGCVDSNSFQEIPAADEKSLIPIKTYTRRIAPQPGFGCCVKGFFKEEGLKLVFTGELKSTEILPSVLNGNNDFAETHPNALQPT
jgi:hypothetical protein